MRVLFGNTSDLRGAECDIQLALFFTARIVLGPANARKR